MALLTSKPKGTQDILPAEVYKWHFVEDMLKEIAANFGYKEIRTPVFEHTELFLRSVGETTDVVQKEMYTFHDKGDRSITLRPEGTAGALRCAVEAGLVNDALPLKLFYIARCFRYEKPQAGRYRQFTQFGIELLGADTAAADFDVISLVHTAFQNLGLANIELQINSIGCPSCRPAYTESLVHYFEAHKGSLCPTCLERLYKNPMRILDCKSEVCAAIAKEAPKNLDYLCKECETDFSAVQRLLQNADIEYTINPRIVRGLDYYTKTVFEFVTSEIGAQGTVCGGGRYNGLVQQLGGPSIGGIGFGMGLERLISLMEKQNCAFKQPRQCELYIVPLGEKAVLEAVKTISLLRKDGFCAETDLVGRSVKAQMKYANKIGARYTVVLGDDEIARQKAKLKNMQTGEEQEVNLGTELISAVYDAGIASAVGQITDDFEHLLQNGDA